MTDDNCVFCKIVKGEIPCEKIYEDDDFLAFLDANPVKDGHTLVIPKQHFRWVWDLSNDHHVKPNIQSYYATVSKIAKHYQKIFYNEPVVSVVFGEGVSHAHVHIIPNASDLSLNHPTSKLTPEKAEKLGAKFSLNIKTRNDD